MGEVMEFAAREDFRAWLSENCLTSGGVWLLFGKPGGPKTIKAGEALEEALCFGWIDGQMQRIDDTAYRKYFSPRRENSTAMRTTWRSSPLRSRRTAGCSRP